MGPPTLPRKSAESLLPPAPIVPPLASEYLLYGSVGKDAPPIADRTRLNDCKLPIFTLLYASVQRAAVAFPKPSNFTFENYQTAL